MGTDNKEDSVWERRRGCAVILIVQLFIYDRQRDDETFDLRQQD